MRLVSIILIMTSVALARVAHQPIVAMQHHTSHNNVQSHGHTQHQYQQGFQPIIALSKGYQEYEQGSGQLQHSQKYEHGQTQNTYRQGKSHLSNVEINVIHDAGQHNGYINQFAGDNHHQQYSQQDIGHNADHSSQQFSQQDIGHNADQSNHQQYNQQGHTGQTARQQFSQQEIGHNAEQSNHYQGQNAGQTSSQLFIQQEAGYNARDHSQHFSQQDIGHNAGSHSQHFGQQDIGYNAESQFQQFSQPEASHGVGQTYPQHFSQQAIGNNDGNHLQQFSQQVAGPSVGPTIPQHFSQQEGHDASSYPQHFNQQYFGHADHLKLVKAPLKILDYQSLRHGHVYQYKYHTENGIQGHESGKTGKHSQVEGAYSYMGDDGKVYSVTYIADEHGFRPQGAHLPTSPPATESQIAQDAHGNNGHHQAEVVTTHQQDYHEEHRPHQTTGSSYHH